MTLPVNFADAHRRHWKDAEILNDSERLANADQLYGFSAECGIKAVMQGLGIRAKPSGDRRDRGRHRKHVQDLWPEFKTFAKGRKGQQYLRHLSGSPFGDWSHHQRYAPTGYAHKEAVAQHRHAALGILRMVRRAEQDGTL